MTKPIQITVSGDTFEECRCHAYAIFGVPTFNAIDPAPTEGDGPAFASKLVKPQEAQQIVRLYEGKRSLATIGEEMRRQGHMPPLGFRSWNAEAVRDVLVEQGAYRARRRDGAEGADLDGDDGPAASNPQEEWWRFAQSQREAGESWDRVAMQLAEAGYPPPQGHGKWYGQLLKMKLEAKLEVVAALGDTTLVVAGHA